MNAMRTTSQVWKTLLCAAVAFTNSGAAAETPPKAPVPASPYLPIIYRYADTMIERGRDTNGLFFSALDRKTLAPLTNRPAEPAGVRDSERVGTKDSALIGSNPMQDQNFLRLLYTLSELSGKPKYRDAADAELKWFVQQSKSDFFRPWMLWDRCFDVAPEASRKFADTIKNSSDTPREAGFLIRTRAVAYARTRDDAFTRAIGASLSRLETGAALSSASPAAIISLAIDCDGAAMRGTDPLATRLRAVAERADEIFREKERFSPSWNARHGVTTAQIGMMCVSRYDNTGKVFYRELIHATANAYTNSMPPENEDLWPGTLGQAISLQLAAWRSTAQPVYLARARAFADFAVQKFFDSSPLPRASLKSEHYETIAGADTLALALVELHLNVLHITAVRCPPNTIDR